MEENGIIDIHTHIYPATLARRAMAPAGRENDPYEKLPLSENLLSRMREEDVALSVVSHVVTKPRNQRDVNRFAAEIRRSNLLSFGGFHPDCDNPMEELEILKDMRMAGVKFHPPFQMFSMTDPKYREIFKRINALGFPVLIHCGEAREPKPGIDLFPSGVLKIIDCFSDVPVILAHMGGRSEDPAEEKILLKMPENVFLDTAMSAEYQAPEEFERLAAAYGPERVLFGSDFPYGTQKGAIAYIKNSCFSEHEKAMMLGGTAGKILKDFIRSY